MSNLEWLLFFTDILLAACGLILAAAGIFGYFFIRQGAERIAQKTAERKMQEFIDSGQPKQMIERELANQTASLYEDMEQSPTHDFPKKMTRTGANYE